MSIIIPTYNEAATIASIISHLKENLREKKYEIIISDGGSTDETVTIARSAGAQVLISPIKGRSGQMNYGVKNASGDVYYFLHADSLPIPSFYTDIEQAIGKNFDCGSFRTTFDNSMLLLKFNAFFTRFNYLFFRGGDQSIFVTKALWEKVGTFKEEMLIMEDYDFLARIWEHGRFKLVPKATLVSARKYVDNSWLTVQLANLEIVKMYKKGATQNEMLTKYKELLSYRKNAF
ncbi:TIGR04283 family arsenosugar biosynthesis glycosyltransferase [Flavobacterium algicola]|uniref:TIGR04283 family arsenosugar biosynthesis glycosyltransferase n=1 Tax=Flavobacterium algicola TaxID=556529 RepID=UPI001EFEB63E|nr:TIGR04283 family arsenosugar biosynthesis glycosyltransferase [Flavobacterium algicola]MCG9793865.1 TIGR04283 family arsenosugar biosynthesis glycosyltransferase [Flavobacterium algicola]